MTTETALRHLFTNENDSRLTAALAITAPRLGDVYQPLAPWTQQCRVAGPWVAIEVAGLWRVVRSDPGVYVLQKQDGVVELHYGGTYLFLSRGEIESKLRRVEDRVETVTIGDVVGHRVE